MRDENLRLRAVAWVLLSGWMVGCGGSSGDAGENVPDTGRAADGEGALEAGRTAEGGGASEAGDAGTTLVTDGSSDGTGVDGPGTPAALSPTVAPGGNFDLSVWELQLPTGSPGAPTTIAPAALEGPNGFQNADFFTDTKDGAMTFFDPENGVTTANSDYPRSELREMNADGTVANWAVAGTNTLSATLAVVQVPDHVCVGQIHLGTAIEAGLAASTKPLLELYYHSSGVIELGIEDSPAGTQTLHTIATVPLGTKFSYTIQLTGAGTIMLVLDGTSSTFTMPASFDGYGMYFKAGDYDQTADADAGAAVGATVKFYGLNVSH